MPKPSLQIPTSLAFALILATTWLIYAPGLSGGFLFDDFANLPALGSSGPITHWATFWRYITSGTADPTGRPLTLLTFLLDARDWPADPFPFKRTSLILHLLNGALLALLLRRLGQSMPWLDAKRINAAAVLGAGLWLMHPLFVSTTLYIVQREAMLPATFTLLGLLLWLRGRRLLGDGRTAAGLLWVALGLGCTVLGTLSKANGALLPALALVIEFVLLRSVVRAGAPPLAHRQNPRTYRWVMLLLAVIPTTLVACYLLQQGWLGITHGISATRPWTLGQRLLTEPRVLMDYLSLLWLPRPFTAGVFNDQIVASTSLFSPWSTLPALLAVLGLIAAAWLLRRRHPALALAVLFYFAAQTLESSTIALELYFEHRNYLPAMLMFWPLALWLCDARRGTPVGAETSPICTSTPPFRPWAKAKLLLAAVLLLGLALMTHARASLWGNTHDQALLWAQINPESARAQANAAAAEMHAGQPARAVARLRPAVARAPDQVQLALNLFNAECQQGRVDDATLRTATTALRTSRDTGTLLASWFERAMDELHDAPCPQLNAQILGGLLAAAASNPSLEAVNGRRQDLYYLQGRLALIQGDPNTALADFDRSLDQQVRASAALAQAALLGAKGFPRQGLAHLDHFSGLSAKVEQPGFGMPRIHAWVLQKQQYWPSELAHLRETLRADAIHQQQAETK